MKKPVSQLTAKKVFVVGENNLQNELIVSALEKETSIPCLAVADLAQVKPSLHGSESTKCLILYDCLGKDGKDCLADLEHNEIGQSLLLGLFNLERGTGLEKDAISCGVRGFFYRGESFNLFAKGVAAIFEGEFWVSRRLLSELIPQERTLSGRMQLRLLSKPEKEVLGFMVGGATNNEIADAMFISRHTVKNHLQKIFRKINVHSKTQAVLWAASHLQF